MFSKILIANRGAIACRILRIPYALVIESHAATGRWTGAPRSFSAWPAWPASEVAALATPIDFLGLNYYTRSVVGHDPQGWPVPARALGIIELCYGDTGLLLSMPRQGLGNAAIAGHRTRHAARRNDRAGPRHRHHAKARIRHGGDQPGARVADRRRARIADQRHALVALEPPDHALRSFAFVVLVSRHQRLVQPKVRHQRRGGAGVFARHRVDKPEHVDRTQAQVGQVADRRRDDVQSPSRILLRTGGRASRLEQGTGPVDVVVQG